MCVCIWTFCTLATASLIVCIVLFYSVYPNIVGLFMHFFCTWFHSNAWAIHAYMSLLLVCLFIVCYLMVGRYGKVFCLLYLHLLLLVVSVNTIMYMFYMCIHVHNN